MNHKLLWTVVALFSTVFGSPSIGRTQVTNEAAPISPTVASSDVVKVGEYQSKAENLATVKAAIAEIHTHDVAGRRAATLYLRNIPVLTFVGKEPISSKETKVGVIGDIGVNVGGIQSLSPNALNQTKVASIKAGVDIQNQTNAVGDDPVQRATVVAAKLNQLVLDKVDANKITVSWASPKESTASENQHKDSPSTQHNSDGRYIIKIDGKELVEIDGDTRLADTTNDRAKDALQATNRIRRLMGNALPLNEIANLPMRSPLQIPKISVPNLPTQIARRVRGTLSGMASWYGYDGSGNRTATGERYNPEGLTAAHRSLPFGTRVRVTNTRNGRSVVVRINDRGPFIRGRIIDLSAGAARILGLMRTGVAPVRVEVLGR
ncbi:septal ring lytic transglycosylase RlpA family protein [Scytonema sp. NUACC21]